MAAGWVREPEGWCRSGAKCLRIDLLLLQAAGSRAGAAARAMGGTQMSPWAARGLGLHFHS